MKVLSHNLKVSLCICQLQGKPAQLPKSNFILTFRYLDYER